MAGQQLWEGMLAGKPTKLYADQDEITLEHLTEGLFANIASGAIGFAKAHPFITTVAGIAAIDAIKQYNKNKKLVKFSAKDSTERKSMQTVIDQMVKSGYKVVRQAHKGASGYEWELTKK